MTTNPQNKPDEKHCNSCKQPKLLSRFSGLSSTDDGLKPTCKDCCAAVSRRHYWNNKERLNKQHESYRLEHMDATRISHKLNPYPEHSKAMSAVHHAVKTGKMKKEDCVDCGNSKTNFHHNNGYDKDNYFVGVWLCNKCHAAEHVRLRGLYVPA